MIDTDGFRPNVGIIVANSSGDLLWARRVGQTSWQFPQGGIRREETPEQALFRELEEEVGLFPEDVQVLGRTPGWLRYHLPKRYLRKRRTSCIGQKQIWFLLRLVGDERCIRLDCCSVPEFDHWQWVDYQTPVNEIVDFKRGVYRQALEQLRATWCEHFAEPSVVRGSSAY